MKLRPLDIKRQQFAKAFRGYDTDEVDGFLKQIADQWEDLLDSLRATEDRVKEMEGKLKHYERIELALQEALETTRENARRTEETADRKARLVIEEAELRAQRLLEEAERERFGLRQDLVKLNARQTEVAARLRSFLLSELEILAQFQGDDPIGFIKLQASGRDAGGPHTLPPPPAQLEEAQMADVPDADAASAATSSASDSAGSTADDTADDSSRMSEGDVQSAEAPAYAAPGDPVAPSGPASAADDPWAGLTTSFPAGSGSDTPPDAAGSEPAFEPAPMPHPRMSPWTTPEAPEPSAGPTTGEPPASEEGHASEEASEEGRPAAPSPAPETPSSGWSLRSLVTGEEESVAGSEAERERIRRILDDLD